MFRFGFLWRILMIMVIIALLAGAGVATYRSGFAQGYQTALITAGKAGSGTIPQLPYVYPPFGFHPWLGFPGFFPFFGALVGIGFFLLIFFLISGAFHFAFSRHWAKRGEWGHGPYGPGPWGYGPYGWRHDMEDKESAGPQAQKGAGPAQSA